MIKTTGLGGVVSDGGVGDRFAQIRGKILPQSVASLSLIHTRQ